MGVLRLVATLCSAAVSTMAESMNCQGLDVCEPLQLMQKSSTWKTARNHSLQFTSNAANIRANISEVEAKEKMLDQMLQDTHLHITEGHSEFSVKDARQARHYNRWAHMINATICETGFNAGHSALRFLAQSPMNKVFEWDIGDHDYARPAHDYLSKLYPGRLTVTWGDSTKTLPGFKSTQPDVSCDLLIVDGGHDHDVALADLVNFAALAATEHILTIDDTPCERSWCEGPTRAWKELIADGCIEETESIPMGFDQGFSVGRYKSCPRFRA